jgi:hypothetical protein
MSLFYSIILGALLSTCKYSTYKSKKSHNNPNAKPIAIDAINIAVTFGRYLL